MAKAKYQFEDFLITVKVENKDFVIKVHEMLLQENYKPKIQATKANGLQISYSQPKIKTVDGIILIFLFRNDELMVRLYATNYKNYLDVLNDLPERIVSQIDKAEDCIKFTNPERCWKGCIGYEFFIGENHYQKCYTQCFQLEIYFELMSYLLKLLECESKARCSA